jgi:hypothetical protein
MAESAWLGGVSISKYCWCGFEINYLIDSIRCWKYRISILVAKGRHDVSASSWCAKMGSTPTMCWIVGSGVLVPLCKKYSDLGLAS